ncbi:MAG: alpha-L-glutamate ligase, partial [Bacteroidia bacterium]|nr:alpha-L-glutamate ligase [Bacteroidia bacterium]
KLYQTLEQLSSDIDTGSVPESLDGILLVQEYIKPQDGRVTRLEFIGGAFYYAVSIDSSNGFELCPADACNVGDAFCPATPDSASSNPVNKFQVLENYIDPNMINYQRFLQASGINIGAIEVITDATGRTVAYDVNTNTNYNSGAEGKTQAGYRGMHRIAEYLREELRSL